MPRKSKPRVQQFDTFDEAVRALKAQLGPGCELVLHTEECRILAGGSDEDCTCTPTVLVGGAQA